MTDIPPLLRDAIRAWRDGMTEEAQSDFDNLTMVDLIGADPHDLECKFGPLPPAAMDALRMLRQ